MLDMAGEFIGHIENNPEYMRAKIMVMVMELRKKWKGKVFMSFMQL